MKRMCCLLSLAFVATLNWAGEAPAAETNPTTTPTPVESIPLSAPPIPPSPSTAPGIRIWPDPHFTHWPAIAYNDEARNIAFTLPIKKGGVSGAIGWKEQETPFPITLPNDAESCSGLLPLPLKIGEHIAYADIDGARFPLRVRIIEARDAWPIVRLENGFPVDKDGTPVVLVDRRRGTREERMWALLDGVDSRPQGRALIVGDPLQAMGQSAWENSEADKRVAHDERYPQHAVMVALAQTFNDSKNAADLPRTIAWCPGNQVLYGAAWSAEEERVLGLVRTRCERLGKMPRLVLCLPPMPVDEQLQTLATERRELLQRSASRMGWVVVDLARAAGEPAQANLVSAGVFTRYPQGEAMVRMQTALQTALAK